VHLLSVSVGLGVSYGGGGVVPAAPPHGGAPLSLLLIYYVGLELDLF
jgi:hypothetical protein